VLDPCDGVNRSSRCGRVGGSEHGSGMPVSRERPHPLRAGRRFASKDVANLIQQDQASVKDDFGGRAKLHEPAALGIVGVPTQPLVLRLEDGNEKSAMKGTVGITSVHGKVDGTILNSEKSRIGQVVWLCLGAGFAWFAGFAGETG